MDQLNLNAPAYGASPDPVTGQPAAPPEMPYDLRQRVLSSANWFFWIAALSLVNSLATHFGSSWNFVVGLGLTQIADAILGHFAGAGTAIAILFDVFVAAIFAGLGLMGRKFYTWAFVVGMVLYTLDALLFVVVGDFLSIAFHAYALYCIFVGFNMLRQYRSATAA